MLATVLGRAFSGAVDARDSSSWFFSSDDSETFVELNVEIVGYPEEPSCSRSRSEGIRYLTTWKRTS